MNNPIKNLSRKEWLLWIGSLCVLIFSNIISGNIDWLTLFATITGVTSLIFAAKGNVWAQILMIIFSILYGIISYRFRYWGEMITYLGMTLPMAVWSAFTWFKNPKLLGTPNILLSTISITTSFIAASLTMLRSSYFALGYAANDIILIILWALAAAKDPVYFPVIINFIIFFLNDIYGFICWKKREKNS